MERNAEVVVIGGGSTGTSILYHLAKRGVVDSILVERGQVGSGQTSKSAAILRTHYSHPTLVKMALKSYRFFQKFDQEVRGYNCGFKRTGLIIGADSNSESGLKENLKMHKQLGIETKIMDQEEVKIIEPELDPSQYSAIVYEPEAGYAEPSTTAASFASAASDLGSKVLANTEVTGIKKSSAGITVETSGGSIQAHKVVLATGVWFNRFAKMLQLDISVQPVRHAVCLFRRPNEFSGTRPIVFDFPKSAAFKPEGEFSLNVSSLETLGGEVDPDNYDKDVSFDEVSRFSGRVSEAFPIMSGQGKLSVTFTGLYDNTPDEQPIIDDFSDQGLENLY